MTKIVEVLFEVYDRIRARTPIHFKRIRNVGAAAFLLGLAGMLVKAPFGDPVEMKHYAEILTWAAGLAALIAQTAKIDNNDSNEVPK